ncbi:MAG: hypothetical protein L6290_07655 [Thermodesulfovibrionales bacterium]|nr:hypothetical protein [Thermodesulfovibrionales bacterium]
MAQGDICPKCGYYMYAISEKEDLDGSWIVYECRNERCKYRMKSFESQPADLDFNVVKLDAQN